jgi:hypothetical protein
MERNRCQQQLKKLQKWEPEIGMALAENHVMRGSRGPRVQNA